MAIRVDTTGAVTSGSLVFRSQRGYDASSNVTAVNTTLAAGADNQAFCYDEQNRLTWAGSSGTPACSPVARHVTYAPMPL